MVPAGQRSAPNPRALYEKAKAERDPPQRSKLLLAAANERYPAACVSTASLGGRFRRDLPHVLARDKQDPRVQGICLFDLMSPMRSSPMAKYCGPFLTGMAIECGLIPSQQPRIDAIAAYTEAPLHVLACERLSCLQESGINAFAKLLHSRLITSDEDDLVVGVIYAAVLGHELLSPLLEFRSGREEEMPAATFFEGMFALLVASVHSYTRASFLVAQILSNRLRRPADNYYDAAARHGMYSARLVTHPSQEWAVALPPRSDKIFDALLPLLPCLQSSIEGQLALSQECPRVRFYWKGPLNVLMAVKEKFCPRGYDTHEDDWRLLLSPVVPHAGSVPYANAAQPVPVYANDPQQVPVHGNVATHPAAQSPETLLTRIATFGFTSQSRTEFTAPFAQEYFKNLIIGDAISKLQWRNAQGRVYRRPEGDHHRCDVCHHKAIWSDPGGSLTDLCGPCWAAKYAQEANLLSDDLLSACPGSQGFQLLLLSYEEVRQGDTQVWVSLPTFEFVMSQLPPKGSTQGAWLNALCSTQCFYGRISTEGAAEEVGKTRGRFLTRLSSVPGALTLSVGLGEGRAQHHRILRTPTGAFAVKLKKTNEAMEMELESVSLWTLIKMAWDGLGLQSPAGPSCYRTRMPREHADPSGLQ